MYDFNHVLAQKHSLGTDDFRTIRNMCYLRNIHGERMPSYDFKHVLSQKHTLGVCILVLFKHVVLQKHTLGTDVFV